MKRILFVTGTRADFGKLKSLIKILDSHPDFEVSIFVTGMHMQSLYGSTYLEVERCGCKRIFKLFKQSVYCDPCRIYCDFYFAEFFGNGWYYYFDGITESDPVYDLSVCNSWL